LGPLKGNNKATRTVSPDAGGTVERDSGANAIASGFEGWIRYGVNEGHCWPFFFAPPGADGAAVEGTGGGTDAEAFGATVGPFATGGIPVTGGDGGGSNGNWISGFSPGPATAGIDAGNPWAGVRVACDGGWVASGLFAPCNQDGNWEDWQPPSNNITANSHATA